MKTYLTMIATAFMLCVLLGTSSCSDDEPVKRTTVTIQLLFPDDVDISQLQDPKIEVRNVSTSQTMEMDYGSPVELNQGLYDLAFTADYKTESGATGRITGQKSSVHVEGESMTIELPVLGNIQTDDLVISEIFFAGTQYPSQSVYYGDQYIKLYNNTDHVVYADGLTLFETKFTSSQKFDYTPDLMGSDVSVQALYTIPGAGHDHPVQPGQYILLADNGMDHRPVNANSFSLAHADWEWYDISSNPKYQDIDSPEVPNLDKWYCYTNTYFNLHNRGLHSYGIARIPVDKETYLADYNYTYQYTLVTAAGSFPMKGNAYRIPNAWVVDVVNLSVPSVFQWVPTAPQLDMGWTGCGLIDNDKNRFFKAVRRKVLTITTDGRVVLKDTNNSSKDFYGDVIPSEIENQNSAMDVIGTPCSQKTYDGVMPCK